MNVDLSTANSIIAHVFKVSEERKLAARRWTTIDKRRAIDEIYRLSHIMCEYRTNNRRQR
jgi:hypothetical protein